MTATADLTVQGVTQKYPTANGELTILTGVDLQLRRGDAIAITGPSGSGKSTLLYMIGLLDVPSSGSIQILGTNPFQLGASQQAGFRNAHIGFIFQDHHLLPQCNVLENVMLPTLAGKGADAAVEDRAKKLLERVGLGDRFTHSPSQISGGERQRVAVCRALITQPEIILADEPTGNLDRKTATSVGSLLLDLCQEQNTLLICVTHSQELAGRFPVQYELLDGKLVKQSAQTAKAP